MKKMHVLTVCLMLITLASCCKRISTCPEFPSPNEHVKVTLHELSKTDQDLKDWLNDLLRLKRKLSTRSPQF